MRRSRFVASIAVLVVVTWAGLATANDGDPLILGRNVHNQADTQTGLYGDGGLFVQGPTSLMHLSLQGQAQRATLAPGQNPLLVCNSDPLTSPGHTFALAQIQGYVGVYPGFQILAVRVIPNQTLGFGTCAQIWLNKTPVIALTIGVLWMDGTTTR